MGLLDHLHSYLVLQDPTKLPLALFKTAPRIILIPSKIRGQSDREIQVTRAIDAHAFQKAENERCLAPPLCASTRNARSRVIKSLFPDGTFCFSSKRSSLPPFPLARLGAPHQGEIK